MPTPTAQLNVGLLLLLTSSRVVLTATVFKIVQPMTCHLCTHPTTNLPAPSADHLNTQPQTCHVFTPFTGCGNSHTHGRRHTNKQIRNNSWSWLLLAQMIKPVTGLSGSWQAIDCSWRHIAVSCGGDCRQSASWALGYSSYKQYDVTRLNWWHVKCCVDFCAAYGVDNNDLSDGSTGNTLPTEQSDTSKQ